MGMANKMSCVSIMAKTSGAKQATGRTGHISTAATVGETVWLIILCVSCVSDKFAKCYDLLFV